MAKRAHQILKKGKARDEKNEESLHKVRISSKKLRYALEFFKVYMKKERNKATLAPIEKFQDCLGSLNDAAVSQILLNLLQGRLPKESDPAAIGMVVG
ncbi:MAG: CHAD domain-containing protein [Rhodospirillales bacterium]|nr:CHAD domain-containing protein [Rhodospirillales bacterium]